MIYVHHDTCIYMYIHICIHTHIYIYVYIYIWIYIYIHIQICIYISITPGYKRREARPSSEELESNHVTLKQQTCYSNPYHSTIKWLPGYPRLILLAHSFSIYLNIYVCTDYPRHTLVAHWFYVYVYTYIYIYILCIYIYINTYTQIIRTISYWLIPTMCICTYIYAYIFLCIYIQIIRVIPCWLIHVQYPLTWIPSH